MSKIPFERNYSNKGFKAVAGVDEAGRGPLAGPVVAGAVIFPEDYQNPAIKDSKKLTPRARESAFFTIMAEAKAYAVGVATTEEIDMFNIHQASLLAMRRSVEMLDLFPDCVLVDDTFEIPGLDLHQEAIKGGDRSVISIAAASIVAKVTRDAIMERYDDSYPQYHFASHKGYPTRAHREAILRHGPSPIHRKTFRGVSLDE